MALDQIFSDGKLYALSAADLQMLKDAVYLLQQPRTDEQRVEVAGIISDVLTRVVELDEVTSADDGQQPPPNGRRSHLRLVE